jgi:hypothetical protein
MVTEIRSNGSKWAGESPDGIEVLEHRLRTETLDPTFEKYGNFIRKTRGGPWKLFGNFLTYSHVFNITTYDAALARRLRKLIRANQATEAYQDARGR